MPDEGREDFPVPGLKSQAPPSGWVSDPEESKCVGGPLDGYLVKDTWHLVWHIRSTSTGRTHVYSWNAKLRHYSYMRTIDA